MSKSRRRKRLDPTRGAARQVEPCPPSAGQVILKPKPSADELLVLRDAIPLEVRNEFYMLSDAARFEACSNEVEAVAPPSSGWPWGMKCAAYFICQTPYGREVQDLFATALDQCPANALVNLSKALALAEEPLDYADHESV